MSITFDMEGGIASYVGAAGVGAAVGAGREAARAAAIDVAAMIFMRGCCQIYVNRQENSNLADKLRTSLTDRVDESIQNISDVATNSYWNTAK
jgi:uncharacterized membrane protein YhiD involved in acid resistance